MTNDAGRSVVVRDAVWGDIELEPYLVDALDTPEVQRLRGIRQLGTAHLVYPGANHTRFEHVLGTCHVAGRILEALARAGRALPPEVVQATRAAALVHDVGHVPFGHTFEDERRIFPRHDGAERTRAFLGDTPLGDALRRRGLADLVLGALGAGPACPPVVSDVVAGTVSADLLDYLARDAHATGIRRAYDERVFRYMDLDDGRLVLRLQKRGLPREDAFSEVIHLLRLRYTLSERVYFHHAKVASGALVSKLVERAVTLGLELPELFGLGDEGLLLHLERVYGPRDPVIVRLLDDLRRRRLPKRAFLLTRRVGPDLQRDLVRRLHHDRAERERVERELEAAAGLDPGDVIVYCPGAEMSLKEADILVDTGRGGLRMLADLRLPEVDELLEKHRALWKLQVLLTSRRRDARAALSRACAEALGAPDELVLG
ncbi:MAG: HD domain-containing protein [Planctomycetes bacterium]|nr:HD domain-containing protein [Planctomycetota bacterium]